MDPNRQEVDGTLPLIATLDLPHPSGALLSSFVTDALHPLVAARYVSDRLSAGEARSLVSDWIYIVESVTANGRPPSPPDADTQKAIMRRDGNKCCITGKAGSIWDPLLVMPILPIPSGWIADKSRVFGMLGAFFSPPYRDWWLSYASDPEKLHHYRSHWLVQKSAARAFAQGFVQLDRRQPSMIEYKVKSVLIGPGEPVKVQGAYALLGDHSRSDIASVDARFIGTQARLATSIQYVELARNIAPRIFLRHPSGPPATGANNPPTRRSTSQAPLPLIIRHLGSLISFPIRAFVLSWRILPKRVRMATYDGLAKLGELIYGNDGIRHVQRLPFGLYLKSRGNADMLRNEFNALRRVHQETSIPAPEPLDVIAQDENSYLLMTRVPGMPLWRCQELFSDTDCDEMVTQLKDYVAQLRDMPKTVNPEMAICNTLGEACRDHRIRSSDPIGPFVDEAAFSQCVRFSDEPSRRGHKIVFTHADLNPRNILVDKVALPNGSSGWRVTGIVDWETAGYYPEYWDYTKALFEGFRWRPRYLKMVHKVFAEFGDYSRELDVETRAWESGDAV
ncbi:kinase-like domain-containing protein [Chaetomidium leptoderma]|uniref:Kinase-like domain-containing protein n=1 Tax=Chaetomidium leptoderma TaxID=669021 RepID=A0AAN6VIK7_9PEZI|nr:kinase-like domain-containing protein [Chaetomidium leptoderma]